MQLEEKEQTRRRRRRKEKKEKEKRKRKKRIKNEKGGKKTRRGGNEKSQAPTAIGRNASFVLNLQGSNMSGGSRALGKVRDKKG